VQYTKKVEYTGQKELDTFTAADTEIYLNHQFDGPRTQLLGLKWTEPKSGRTYMQDTVGWEMKVGKGEAYYFMVGHKAADFDIPAYAQILTNAVVARRPKS
jgi:type 1 glutamine amidotransferase